MLRKTPLEISLTKRLCYFKVLVTVAGAIIQIYLGADRFIGVCAVTMEVSLQSGGSLWNKLQAPAPSGLVSTVFNPPVKDRIWKITKVCVHHRTGHIATADERGQVYSYSLDDNSYSCVRLASTPVSALDFIQSRKNELMIAYQNGSIVVVNIESKLIVGTIRLPSPSPIILIRCHVKAPVATMLAQDGSLSMWDLR
jgi:hypothetical protein